MKQRNHNKNNTLVMRVLLRLVLLGWWCTGVEHRAAAQSVDQGKTMNLTFLLLRGTSNFSDPIEKGFLDTCQEKKLQLESSSSLFTANEVPHINCHVRQFIPKKDLTNCPVERLQHLKEFVHELQPTAMAINIGNCLDDDFFSYLRNFTATGNSLATYGKDLPAEGQTGRFTFIGTDDAFMGRTVARLVRQLRPEGGTFATVGYKKGRNEAFQAELQKHNHLLGRAHWHEIPELAAGQNTAAALYPQQLHNYSTMNPTAIVTLLQTPMRVTPWPELIAEHKHRNITYVGVDADDYQLDYLNRKLVNGLVGQLPFEIGSTCFEALYNHSIWKRDESQQGNTFVFPDRIKTNLVSYGIIPLELPELDVEENLLGALAWLGYIFFGIVALAVLYCIGWTLRNRRVDAIVRAAQPVFLIMIAVGVLCLASSMIPLSFDDGGEGDLSPGEGYIPSTESDMSDTFKVGICMSVPWLAFTGFTIIFSALFSKTWRVNKIVKSAMQSSSVSGNPEQRANIASETDVLFPFAILLSCNWAILLSWTLWDPLTYVRLEREGTDYWNRVIETYGVCQSENANAFLIPLGVLNFAGVIMSCWQAFQTRNITSEFSESKYIALTVVSLCQGFLTGIPVIVVVRESPQAFYIVLCITTFLLSAAVLGLIFGPKMWIQRNYRGKSPAEQSLILRQAVLKNSDSGNSGSGSGSGGVPHRVDSFSTWSSDVAYRSDHRRFNEPTVSSIPEDRAVIKEDSDDEFDRETRFETSLVTEDLSVSKPTDETASRKTTSVTLPGNESDSNSTQIRPVTLDR